LQYAPVYRLTIINPAHADRPLTIRVDTAADVLELLPRLVEDHPDCERIEVRSATRLLFSVDCASNRP
jgi:hypothetical protein